MTQAQALNKIRQVKFNLHQKRPSTLISRIRQNWLDCHQYQQRRCENRRSEYRCNVIIGAVKALCSL